MATTHYFSASVVFSNPVIAHGYQSVNVDDYLALQVSNRGNAAITLYFKLVCNIPNWALTTPATGQLGSVASASLTTFYPVLRRSYPESGVVDTGDLTIEAYSDSGYTTLVGTAVLPLSISSEDWDAYTTIESYSDFVDWTLTNMTVRSDLAMVAGKSSLAVIASRVNSSAGSTGVSGSGVKTITVPDLPNVRMFFWLHFQHYITYTNSNYAGSFKVSLGTSVLLNIPDVKTFPSLCGAYWRLVSMDLSSFRGQTLDLKFEPYVAVTSANSTLVATRCYVSGLTIAAY